MCRPYNERLLNHRIPNPRGNTMCPEQIQTTEKIYYNPRLNLLGTSTIRAPFPNLVLIEETTQYMVLTAEWVLL